MKAKTINAILTKKMNDWLKHIEDDQVVRLIKRDVIVTGGCIASMLLNEDVKDFDVYFKTKETTLAVARYYADLFNQQNKNHKNKLGGAAQAFVLDGEDVEAWQNGDKNIDDIAPGFSNQGSAVSRMVAGCTPERVKIIVRSDGVAAADGQETILEEPFEDVFEVLDTAEEIPEDVIESNGPYRPVFLSTNAITLSNKIQIVARFYGEPEEIHGNYDFVHCTNYWTFDKGTVLNQPALEALMQKELVYIGSKYPLCSVIRTRKFIKRGFQINAGQYLKMCFQISELDLTDIDVLEDQLVGVDSMYFMSLIRGLRSKMGQDPNFKIEHDYVSSIIDRIF
jgi:hypothetical protein